MDKPYKYCNHFNEFKYINFSFSYGVGLRGAMVARLTPDQKAACSSHVGVTEDFFFLFFFIEKIPVFIWPHEESFSRIFHFLLSLKAS